MVHRVEDPDDTREGGRVTVVALLVVGACVLGAVRVVYAIKRMDERT